MAAKDIKFQKCMMNLEPEKKGQWHLDINGGLVPVLEAPDGTVIFESAVIMSFAHDFAKPDQGLALWPHDRAPPGDTAAAMRTSEMRLDMLEFDKLLGKGFWPFFMSKFDNEETNAKFLQLLPELEAWIVKKLNSSDYLSGTSEPMMIDFHVFPFIERLVILEGTVFDEAFKMLDLPKNCPKLYEYVHRFRKHPRMEPHVCPIEGVNKWLIKKKNKVGEGKASLDTEMISDMFPVKK